MADPEATSTPEEPKKEPEKKRLEGICRDCARFPARQDLSGKSRIDDKCPVPKRKDTKTWHIDDFQKKEKCEFHITEEQIQAQEPQVGFPKHCFIPSEEGKSCYEGCPLFNEKEDACQIMLTLKEYTDKCSLEIVLLEAEADKRDLLD